MTWLALDIGGANLKAADGVGFAASRPFALWRAPDRLAAELQTLIATSPAATRLAITMTGELADCYATKAVGVRSILDAVETASAGRPISVYLTGGRFASVDEARETPLLAAASNWRALAAFAMRFAFSWPAMLIDMGSTTTDIIPLNLAGPCPVGLTDTERLLSHELAYTGVERTPINAIVQRLPWRDRPYPVAAELFATALDAYLLLGDLPEDSQNTDTADRRPRTRDYARARMARMICSDITSFSEADAEASAAAVRDAQLELLETATRAVAGRLKEAPRILLLSGQGEFLLRRLASQLGWNCTIRSLSQELGEQVSRCAAAHALAVLAREQANG